jgi:hypothetical protein
MGVVGQGSDGSTLSAQARTLDALARAALALRPPMPFEKRAVDELGSDHGGPLRWPVSPEGSCLESAKEALEEETRRWAYLEIAEPVEAPH